MSGASGHVWELRYQSGNSNKFYRVYVVYLDDGDADYAYLVCNWGRWGARGQFKVTAHTGSAMNEAYDKLDQKRSKGYELLRDSKLPVVPDDIVAEVTKSEGYIPTSVPAAKSERVDLMTEAVNVYDQFAADADRLIRMVTSAPDLTSEAVVLRSTLTEQLDYLRQRLQASEGQLDLVNDVITMKAGA